MTQRDKRKFITSYFASMKEDALSRVDLMPEEWDGFELRWFLAQQFHRDEAWPIGGSTLGRRRKFWKAFYRIIAGYKA